MAQCPKCDGSYSGSELCSECEPDDVSPAWHDRPTADDEWNRPLTPGDWVGFHHEQAEHPCVIRLSQSDITKGMPYYATRAFGPIPAHPKAGA